MESLRALIYVRVSTDAQERDGTSLETQERACVEYAQESGWLVVERIRDTASGFTLDRPGIERARQLLRQGVVDIVVAHAVDRLSRNQNHIGVLFDDVEQAGAKLEFVTEKFEDTAIGRFILAARAFVGEVEREKIAERTMRGKAERARSGRLPQGTGKGCYGYTYDPATGKRSIEPNQAEVVKRIFREFLVATPIVRIANKLNQEAIPTLTGSKWYPATLHRVVRNETYTGRTIYRRTQIAKKRQGANGRVGRKVEQRPPSEWIEIDGVSPPIIHRDVYLAAQSALDDPERRRLGRKLYHYGLSGRVKCMSCGRAMVGQTLRKRYRYYRCRRAFAGPKYDRCPTVYVIAEALEGAVRQEAARVLSNPELILVEAQRLSANGNRPPVDVDSLGRRLHGLENQRARLLKLYQLGEIDDDYLKRELEALREQKGKVDEKLDSMPSPQPQALPTPTPEQLRQAAASVREWVERAEGDDFTLLVEALQIQVRVEKGRGELVGVIPEYARENSHADVCTMVTKSWAGAPGSCEVRAGTVPSM